MAPQDEVHKESGNVEDSKIHRKSGPEDTSGNKLETTEKQPAPFSEFDPFRATRYSTLTSETQDFLSGMGKQASGFENLDEDQLRSLYSDVEERSRWSKARQDAFTGILRLGTATPPRGNRIL